MLLYLLVIVVSVILRFLNSDPSDIIQLFLQNTFMMINAIVKSDINFHSPVQWHTVIIHVYFCSLILCISVGNTLTNVYH